MVKKVDAGDRLPKGMSQAAAREIIKHETFYGREKENLIYPIGLANLILHGIDDPHIWHGNALTGNEVYGGVKTNLLFFSRGKPTEKTWYYDLSARKVGKKTPLTLDDFREFFELLPGRADSANAWTMDFAARRRKATEEAHPFRQISPGSLPRPGANGFDPYRGREIRFNYPRQELNL